MISKEANKDIFLRSHFCVINIIDIIYTLLCLCTIGVTYKRQLYNGKRPQFAVISGHTLSHRDNIWSLLYYVRLHPNPQRQYPVTSGIVPVPLDKAVIFTVTSGVWPRMTSEVIEVNNFEVPEKVCIWVGPLKYASFNEFFSPKVMWPPTASEAMEVNAIHPITSAPMS